MKFNTTILDFTACIIFRIEFLIAASSIFNLFAASSADGLLFLLTISFSSCFTSYDRQCFRNRRGKEHGAGFDFRV